MPRVLTRNQIAAFERDGFIAPLDGISPVLAAECVSAIEAYEAETGEEVSRSIRVRACLAFAWIMRIARCPAVLGAIQDIIGPDVLIYLSSVWSKQPGGPTFVSWHQDGAYYAFDRHAGLTAWVALTDATEEMGYMRALPGSHREPVRAHAETYDPDNLLSRGQTIAGIDADKAVPMPLRAGQVSIHHEMTVHGSGPNLSDRRRIGISLSCIPAEVRALEGPKSAVLVSGAPGHWQTDPEPRYDLDPVSLAALERVQAAYRDPAFRNEAERLRSQA